MKIRYILQAEGAAIFVLALVIYTHLGGSWWLFGALILTPDLSMVGYVLGLKVGAFCYNFAHAYILPVALTMIGVYLNDILLSYIAVIWFAHIGMDRMIGYGLKYSSGFKHTHFTRL